MCKAINNRLKKQGKERSHNLPKEYGRDWIKWILDSPAGVIAIHELESTQRLVGLRYTTLSGT